MSERNDKSEQEIGEEQDIKRWTAKRRAALVVEILRGQTTVTEAARTHDLKVSDIELWKDTFLTSGENALRSNPRDELELKDKKIFRSLKEECIWQNHFDMFEEARAATQNWVKLYNDKRPHQALGYLSPIQFRAEQLAQSVA
jgi:transposase-like protein